MTEDQKQQVAVFRYGIINEFVGGRRLDHGEQEQLLGEKCAHSWHIPFSGKRDKNCQIELVDKSSTTSGQAAISDENAGVSGLSNIFSVNLYSLVLANAALHF